MGRRSTHTPQQLRELILDAAQDIIQVQGLAGLSAREIARRIEYSPGTIYNMFENLDDVVLHVEARVLEALDKRLSTLLQDGNPADRVGRLAQAYRLHTTRSRVGTCCSEHHMPKAQLPPWYQQKLEGLMGGSRAMAALFARPRRTASAPPRAVGRRTASPLDRGQALVTTRPTAWSRPAHHLAAWPAVAGDRHLSRGGLASAAMTASCRTARPGHCSPGSSIKP